MPDGLTLHEGLKIVITKNVDQQRGIVNATCGVVSGETQLLRWKQRCTRRTPPKKDRLGWASSSLPEKGRTASSKSCPSRTRACGCLTAEVSPSPERTSSNSGRLWSPLA